MGKRVLLPNSSRMRLTPLLQERDADGQPSNDYVWGSWEPPDIPADDTDDVYVVKAHELGRLDLISAAFYDGDSSFWWILLFVNDLIDQFTNDPALDGIPSGTVLRIPKKTRINSILLNRNKTKATTGSTLE